MSSKKLERIENFETFQASKATGRYCNAWKDIETGIYHLNAGYEGMPADYAEEHETLTSLAESMRDFADLRHWTYREIW